MKRLSAFILALFLAAQLVIPAAATDIPADEMTADLSEERAAAVTRGGDTVSGYCGASYDNLTWSYNLASKELVISGTGEMYNYDSHDNHSYNPVVAPWTDYLDEITTVVIGSGVTTIGRCAFENCTALKNVSIPNTVTTIKNNAFRYATGLERITIPDNVTVIEYSAFYCCSNLVSVTLPNAIAVLDMYLFTGCKSLIEVVVPASVTSIKNYAFSECYSLKKVTFLGNAPAFAGGVFSFTTTTAYSPKGNATWTNDVKQDYGGSVTWDNFNNITPTTPTKPYKITNVVSGVHVYWNAVTGADKYGLWRSETGANGTYKWVANPTVPHFTDTKVESGKTYYYKVTAMNAFTGATSAKSAAIGVTYVATPDITKRTNVAAGVQLEWQKITGATGYAIYRKSYSGTDAWARIGTISGNSTFTWTDESVKNNNGEVFKYTIRALAGSDMKTLSGCRNAGRTMVRLSSQVLQNAAKASATSVKASWTTSSRVTGYEVRFTVNGAVAKTFTVGNYKTGTKTFTGLSSGQTYTVQVRTYKKVDDVGSFYSDWSAAKTVSLK